MAAVPLLEESSGTSAAPMIAELGGMAADGACLLRIDRRGVWPAALQIAERVGAHARRLAACGRQPLLDEVGKSVAERA